MQSGLDARQRAMLAEMGVPLFALLRRPGPALDPTAEASAVAAPAAPAPATVRPLTATVPAPAPAPVAAVVADRAPVPAPSQPVVEVLGWQDLAEAVALCQACRLCESRRQPVFGMGDVQADWLIVGDAPGEQEDLQGEPFVGPAGKLLDNMLRGLGLDRQQGVYITNALKCRPPGNRNPDPGEVAHCEPFLRRQVELLRPKVILAMGRFAVQSLLGSAEPIGRLRGRVHRYHEVPVVVTYHPAYLLRNLPDKAKAWADLCLAREQIANQ